jgi:hypothetical protein
MLQRRKDMCVLDYFLAQPAGALLLLGFAAILILVAIIIPMFSLLPGFFIAIRKFISR